MLKALEVLYQYLVSELIVLQNCRIEFVTIDERVKLQPCISRWI